MALGATARAALLASTVVLGACAASLDAAPLPAALATDPAAPSAPAPGRATAPASTATARTAVTLETTVTADEVVLDVAGPVRRGQTATVSAMTAPNAVCSITVTSVAGGRAADLGAKGADGSGNVSWSWTVEVSASPGAWPVEVSCITASASGIRAVAQGLLRVE